MPFNRADTLCRFFLLWSPGVYGEMGDPESIARRGFELITRDLEWDEPASVRRPKPATSTKKAKSALGKKGSGDSGSGEDDDDPLSATAELAKESWEVRTTTPHTLPKTLFQSFSLANSDRAL